MGKFQSKLVSKRRQSPEGGSLVSNVLTCQSELELIRIHKTKLTENLYVELRSNRSDHNCNLKVVLPPKKTPDGGNSLHLLVNKQAKKRNSHANATDCNMVPEEDTRQEWVFTLYNFDNRGKVTKEDMASLIHAIYEVLEASVKRPHGGPTPLKIKLVVTPAADPENSLNTATEKAQTASQEPGNPGRSVYCVDENIERRNHYLDLAGIENYTSKFDNTESLSREPSQDARSAPKHPPVVGRENYISPQPPRGLSIPHCLKSKAVSAGKDGKGGQGMSCRLHGQHPASWCHSSQPPPAAPSVLQRSHSKRVRSRGQNASHFRSTAAGDREILANFQSSRSQRHEHHHHHDHHHHHHHHHPS
ncbi:naked cuticle-like protein 3 [Pseudoliparis swirei]|uniref:naked cuticle-like protein 3 n=1 Tax=Pseudoliparis swirei TaxID=2059687 RepID=UPI0024BE6268|nr:naked cuticle-like protein 3 [Pseudoliparis swirei]